MLKVEINGKEYNIPESFNELTLEQYCKAFYKIPSVKDEEDEDEKLIQIKKNESIILSRIMGEDDEFCLDLPWSVYEKIIKSIDFIYSPDDFLKNSKASIIIDGIRYSVPPMDKMTMRQFIDADVVMKEESPMQYIELLSTLLLTKDDNGEYIPYNGEYQKLVDKLKVAPCSICLPLVFHFFKKGQAFKKLSEASMKVEEAKRLAQHIQNS